MFMIVNYLKSFIEEISCSNFILLQLKLIQLPELRNAMLPLRVFHIKKSVYHEQ